MKKSAEQYVQAAGDHFEKEGKPIFLKGWALGTWMNFEHFMLGLPGTNSQILGCFEEVYGREQAAEFTKIFLESFVREEDIAYMKSLGANTLRIVLGYHHFWDDDAPYVMKEEGLRQLDRVLAFCEKYEMYAVLDLHSTPGGQSTDWHSDSITGQALFWTYRVFQDQVVWFWEEMAKRYADNTWIIGYDVINEPHHHLTADQINGFYRRVQAAIRNYDPHHILFLEGIDFGRDFSPLCQMEDPQIAYTVHFYPFVIDGDLLDPSMDDGERMKVYTDIFERQLSETARLGRPIWCGESGYEIEDGMEEFYGKLLKHNITLAEERGISWNLWTYKDARCMGIVIPKKDSTWMKLHGEIAKSWSHHREQKISMEITRLIGDKYYQPLTNEFAYDIDFRVRSILHQVAVEQVLKAALKRIPWEEMKKYPDSFLFEACDRREGALAQL